MARKELRFENAEGPQWVTTYHLGYNDFDDDLNDSETEEVIFQARDFDTAVRYSQQYLRKQRSESDDWANAEILSIEQY